mmetsp:Transcript_23127/g.41813  ORF Transcript_23127/g.41813 Transcript_23127/m.41813 type:complete len:388 (+) Transcript_23127:85-1248(+)
MRLNALLSLLLGQLAFAKRTLHNLIDNDLQLVEQPNIICRSGQGEAWKAYDETYSSGIDDCAKHCLGDPQCLALDFTAVIKPDMCRLFGTNKPRLGLEFAGRDNRRYCYQVMDPNEIKRVAASWINSNGEKVFECGLGPRHSQARMFLTSSMFFVNESQNTTKLVEAFMSLKPKGKALWIGDALLGARSYLSRFQTFPVSHSPVKKLTGVDLQWTFLDGLTGAIGLKGLAGTIGLGKSNHSVDSMKELLEGVGVVYLAGGDHMHLMHSMRKAFAEVLIPRVLDGSILLMSVSAGTIDAGRDIGFSTELDSLAKLQGNLSGLGLVGDCSLRPHFNSQAAWHDEGTVSQLFWRKLAEQHDRTSGKGKLVTLNDGEAFLVKDGRASIVRS